MAAAASFAEAAFTLPASSSVAGGLHRPSLDATASRDCSQWRSGTKERRRSSSSSAVGGASTGRDATDGFGSELTELQLDSLPWHEAQLHVLFGSRFASDIIRPPMELRHRAKFKSRMRQLEGRTGAKALWGTLRDSSHRKLLGMDERIPAGLKKTYGAFVRQLLLQSGTMPAKRNFTAQDDVEKIEVLLDRSMTLKVKDKRHKVELMNRSSRVNADRMQVLAYNSTFPDLVNASGEEGIDRYLPSWDVLPATDADAEQHEGSTIAGRRRHHVRPALNDARSGVAAIRPDSSLLAIEASLSATAPAAESLEHIHFLTEQEAKCEGQFSSHFRELQQEREGMVKPIRVADGPAASPAAAASGAAAHSRRNSATAGDRVAERQPDLQQQQQEPPRRRLPPGHRPWQPLTLRALVEYSRSAEPTAGGSGTGDFLFGRTKMFPLRVQKAAAGGSESAKGGRAPAAVAAAAL